MTREDFEKEIEKLYCRADGTLGISPRLIRFARKHGAQSEDEAEELVQETLSTLNPGTFRGDSSFETWVCGALRNTIRDHIKIKKRHRRERKVATAYGAVEIVAEDRSRQTEGVPSDEEPSLALRQVEPEPVNGVVSEVHAGGQFLQPRDARDEADLAPSTPETADDEQKLQRIYRGLRHVLHDPSDAPLALPPDESAEVGETRAEAEYLLAAISDPEIRKAIERVYREDRSLGEVASELGYDPARLSAVIEREFARLRTLPERPPEKVDKPEELAGRPPRKVEKRKELPEELKWVDEEPTLGRLFAAAPAMTIKAVILHELRKLDGALGGVDLLRGLVPAFAAALPLVQHLVRGPAGEELDEPSAFRFLVPHEPALVVNNGELRLEPRPAWTPAFADVAEEQAQAWAADLRKLIRIGLREAGARRGRGRPEARKNNETEMELAEEYYALRLQLDLFQKQAAEDCAEFATRVARKVKGLERIGPAVGGLERIGETVAETKRLPWPSSWSRLTEEAIQGLVPQHVRASGRLRVKPLAESLLALAHGAPSPKAIENRIVRFEREFAR